MISIKNKQRASISFRRIAGICLLILFLSGIGVIAANTSVSNVKIVLANDCELDSLTAKTKVSEILEEKHIILLPDEKVIPSMEEQIGNDKTITITKNTEQEEVIEAAQTKTEVSMDEVLKAYAPIVEKIVVEQQPIPFETITKNLSKEDAETTDKVIQQGQEGIKEVTYKVKYQNDKEIEKIEVSSVVIKEPVSKIVQVKAKPAVTNRSSAVREENKTKEVANTSNSSLAARVAGKTPTVKSMNTSAYCSCAKCCGKSNGITGSGAKATSWYTVAAGSAYPIGTVIYIPALKNKPNGGWFVVQDRGGAISNNRIDIFMGSHNQALSFGRKTLECYIYQ